MIRMSLSQAADAINARHVGDDVIFYGCNTDTRSINQDNLFIALHGEKYDGHDFIIQAEQYASSLMLSRYVPHSLPVLMVDDTRKSMGLLAGYWREQMPIPLIAITGSNGKTTVKEMIKSILSTVACVHATTGNYNNDIGVPLTLFGLDNSHQYTVIEMGANHTGEIEWLSAIARPDVAVITQCAPAHLEGFGSIKSVAKAKSEIFGGLKSGGTAVINGDDDYADYWLQGLGKKKHRTFAIENEQANVRAFDIKTLQEKATTSFILKTEQQQIEIELPLLGKHNVMNALAAATCCVSLDIPLDLVRNGLATMQSVAGRLQLKQGMNRSRIIDDTYNANPVSLQAAIRVLAGHKGKRFMVLGDMGELGDTEEQLHIDAGNQAREAGIEALYTLGSLSHYANNAFGKNAQHFESHIALFNVLAEQLDEKTTVLVKGSRFMQMEKIVNALMGAH